MRKTLFIIFILTLVFFTACQSKEYVCSDNKIVSNPNDCSKEIRTNISLSKQFTVVTDDVLVINGTFLITLKNINTYSNFVELLILNFNTNKTHYIDYLKKGEIIKVSNLGPTTLNIGLQDFQTNEYDAPQANLLICLDDTPCQLNEIVYAEEETKIESSPFVMPDNQETVDSMNNLYIDYKNWWTQEFQTFLVQLSKRNNDQSAFINSDKTYFEFTPKEINKNADVLERIIPNEPVRYKKCLSSMLSHERIAAQLIDSFKSESIKVDTLSNNPFRVQEMQLYSKFIETCSYDLRLADLEID